MGNEYGKHAVGGKSYVLECVPLERNGGGSRSPKCLR